MRTVISIVLIISISLLTVMLPMQIGSITTDVSADSSMFIGTFSTAFLAWLIAMLAGLGITIGSLADFNDILSTPAGTSFMNDAYTLWNQQSDLFKVGSYMGASAFVNFRNKVKDWIMSEDTQEIIEMSPEENLQVQIVNGFIYHKGNKVIPGTPTTNPSNYSHGIYGSINIVSSQDSTVINNAENIINEYGVENLLSMSGIYKISFSDLVNVQYYREIFIRDADNNIISTFLNTTDQNNAIKPRKVGWVYYAIPYNEDYSANFENKIMEIYGRPIVTGIRASGNMRAYSYTPYHIETVKNDELYKPYIYYDPIKIANDLTINDVSANDTVSVSIPTTLREQLTDAFTNQSIAVSDVVMPQVEDVPITSTNQYITNNIITNVSEVAIPDLDFDFPELDSFRLPTGITTKFPFSIPFDVGRAFDMMVAPAQAPVFVLPFTIERLNIHHDITLDLTEWESVAEVVRWFLLAIFILILVVVTRKLIKG